MAVASQGQGVMDQQAVADKNAQYIDVSAGDVAAAGDAAVPTCSSASKPRKKAGRPRRDGSRSSNQKSEIVQAAVRLFKKEGYTSTTMSAIAREAGLGQSSLYYWYKSKDDILKELLATNREPLAAADTAATQGAGVQSQLYELLYQDTKALCELPFDYRLLEHAAHKNTESFKDFFEDYERLVLKVAELIEAGVREGVFTCDDALTYAVTAVAADEGAQHRYHNMTEFPHLLGQATPQSVAHAVATLTVRGLEVR